MAEYELVPGDCLPYFAEIPYYIWGEVNYDSDGDCARPRDRGWTWSDFTHRETNERISISVASDALRVEGDEPAAARAALFLVRRCGARPVSGETIPAADGWDHDAAMARSEAVAREFGRPELDAFDSALFFGSWKWIGWFATDFTWVGRWIMHSVVRRDGRAVNLCIDWLRHGTFSAEQSAALRRALELLTGDSRPTDQEWIRWYDGTSARPGACVQYPEPDIEAWLAEMKASR